MSATGRAPSGPSFRASPKSAAELPRPDYLVRYICDTAVSPLDLYRTLAQELGVTRADASGAASAHDPTAETRPEPHRARVHELAHRSRRFGHVEQEGAVAPSPVDVPVAHRGLVGGDLDELTPPPDRYPARCG